MQLNVMPSFMLHLHHILYSVIKQVYDTYNRTWIDLHGSGLEAIDTTTTDNTPAATFIDIDQSEDGMDNIDQSRSGIDIDQSRDSTRTRDSNPAGVDTSEQDEGATEGGGDESFMEGLVGRYMEGGVNDCLKNEWII